MSFESRFSVSYLLDPGERGPAAGPGAACGTGPGGHPALAQHHPGESGLVLRHIRGQIQHRDQDVHCEGTAELCDSGRGEGGGGRGESRTAAVRHSGAAQGKTRGAETTGKDGTEKYCRDAHTDTVSLWDSIKGIKGKERNKRNILCSILTIQPFVKIYWVITKIYEQH